MRTMSGNESSRLKSSARPVDDAPIDGGRVDGRARTIRNAVAIGIATGTYGLSFGALSVTAGLSLPQTCALSILMFTGASQFAFVGVIVGGGSPFAGAAAAAMLGVRNGVHGLYLSRLLRLRGVRRLVGAHLVIDESAALSLAGRDRRMSRFGFWAAGTSVFVCWNLATLIGGFSTRALSDPEMFGLDAVAPAAFVALLAPRLRSRGSWSAVAVAAGVALAVVPVAPPGVPVLLAAVAVVLVALPAAGATGDTDTGCGAGDTPREA